MNISEGQKLIKSKEYAKALNYFLGLINLAKVYFIIINF